MLCLDVSVSISDHHLSPLSHLASSSEAAALKYSGNHNNESDFVALICDNSQQRAHQHQVSRLCIQLFNFFLGSTEPQPCTRTFTNNDFKYYFKVNKFKENNEYLKFCLPNNSIQTCIWCSLFSCLCRLFSITMDCHLISFNFC